MGIAKNSILPLNNGAGEQWGKVMETVRLGYTYNGGDKLLQEVASGVVISYAYDPIGNLTQKSTETSTVRYHWDAEKIRWFG